MKIKYLSWILTLLLVITLVACDLPVVTPPPTEVAPTSTTVTQPTAPPPTQIVEVTQSVTVPIKAGNLTGLIITHKAAASNLQRLSWSQDGGFLALITQNFDTSDNQVYGFSTLNAADLSTRSVYSTSGNRISAVAPDGETIATISNDMMAFSLVNTGNGNEQAGSKMTDYLIGNITFSPDGRYLAVTKQEYWEVVLYDRETLEEVINLTGFETAAPVFNAGFDASPQWMVWFSRGTVQLQEVETGMMGGRFQHEDFLSSYTLSPDGTILATSAGKTVNNAFVPAITLWDTSSSMEIQTLVLDAPANVLRFSPDGKLLAVAVGSDLQLWDPATGTLLYTLTGHTETIHQVAFAPDQKTIATGAMDNQLYLWQIPE